MAEPYVPVGQPSMKIPPLQKEPRGQTSHQGARQVLCPAKDPEPDGQGVHPADGQPVERAQYVWAGHCWQPETAWLY